MKGVSQSLARIIVVLASIALIVSVVMVSSSPISEFFSSVTDTTTDKAATMLDSVTVPKYPRRPTLLDGDGGEFSKLAPTTLRFRSSADFSEFQEVRVDGIVVDPSNYTVTEGSTIIAFNNAFTSSLSESEHSIAIVSEYGSAEGEFSVTNTVPSEGSYTSADGNVYGAGENVPNVQDGDVYVYGNYEYRYNQYYSADSWTAKATQNGWGVRCINNVEDPGEIIGVINEKPIVSLYSTFSGCTNLTKAPIIPNNVTGMQLTFKNCTNLTTAPKIPGSVKNMLQTFAKCTNLTTAPEIPESATNITSIFLGCESLVTAPKIHSTASKMTSAFAGCTSLTGTITINSSPSTYSNCFQKVDFDAQNITLAGLGTILDDMGATGTNYCATCNGKCNGGH